MGLALCWGGAACPSFSIRVVLSAAEQGRGPFGVGGAADGSYRGPHVAVQGLGCSAHNHADKHLLARVVA